MVTLKIENDLLLDAGRDLMRLHALLASRHGEQYRALQRRIDALPDTPFTPELTSLDDETLIFKVPGVWATILSDARKLGLI